MGEQVLAHLGLHFHTDDMTVILYEIPKQHTHNVQGQYHQARKDDGGIHLLGDIDIEHFVGDDGVYHTDHRDQQGCQHIQGQHLSVGLIVVDKTL